MTTIHVEKSQGQADLELFEYPALIDGEVVLYETVVDVPQSCCCGLMVVPICCTTATVRMRITCTTHRLILGRFDREDRFCCCCCTCPAPDCAHNTDIVNEEYFWKDVRSVKKNSNRFSWGGWCFWLCCCCSCKRFPVGDKAQISIQLKTNYMPFVVTVTKAKAVELMNAITQAKAEGKNL